MKRALTWKLACEIRDRWNGGETMASIAKVVDVSLATVSRVCNDRVWQTEKYGQLDYFCQHCGETNKTVMVSSKTCKKCKAKRNSANRRKALLKKRTKMLKELGDRCRLCEVELSAKKSNWTRHHLSYEPEVVVMVCRSCHMWLHGNGQVYANHPIKLAHDKGIAPYIFAKKVVTLYESENNEGI